MIGTFPAAGLVLLALAAGICVACVVGRYHAVDVAAGAGVALLFWLVN